MSITRPLNLEKGAHFRRCREQLGKNLFFVSWRTGLSESTVSKAERGHMTIKTEAALEEFFKGIFGDVWNKIGEIEE